MKKRSIQKETGITLIMLVVTIVVILILAGITIDLAFDENGIIKKAMGVQEIVNQSVKQEEEGLDALTNQLDATLANVGVGGNPNTNNMGGGGSEDPDTPSAPRIEVKGTAGEIGYYRSDVEIVVTANDSVDTLAYLIEGNPEGSVSTETTIENGQSIHITKDGSYTVSIYAYNKEGKKSEATVVKMVKDIVVPNAILSVQKKATTGITVQLVATDPEPSAGLSTEIPYTFYYQAQDGTWKQAGTASSSSYTYDMLEKEVPYNLKAEIKDKAGNIGTSNIIENVKIEKPIEITNTPEWTEPDLKPNEETSFTITTDTPVKIGDESKVSLEPNTTGSTVKIEILNPDENGYGTEIKVTIVAGTGSGEEKVVIGEGALTDETGKTVEEITKPGINIYTEPPTVGEIEVPGGNEGEGEPTVKPAGTPVEITITPSSPNVEINPDKFIPVDADGNPIDADVVVTKGEDGKIHVTITPNENTPDGTIDVVVQKGGMIDPVRK